MMWRRKQSIVNFRAQFWFALELLVIAIGFDILCAFFFFVPPFNEMFDGGKTSEWLFRELQAVIFTKWPLIMVAMVIFVIIGILLAHRLWGPLFGLTRVAQRWKEGDRSARVYFRKYDYLLPVKAPLNEFFDAEELLIQKVESLAREIEGDASKGDSESVKKKATELLALVGKKEKT